MDRVGILYRQWIESAIEDPELIDELRTMSEEEQKDAFGRELVFGTAGLRGILGAGTNRMNIYTVARASQGLSEYILKKEGRENGAVAVGYDSRIKSALFAQTAASVFAANGLHVYLYRELMPTPCVSFAVRALRCSAGVMVTASHNPSQYNGYKVYGPDGCQITSDAADAILREIENTEPFAGIKKIPFEEGLKTGLITYIRERTITEYIDCVKRQSQLAVTDTIDKSASIVYTPLNGTGLVPVLRTLRECGYTNISVVPEQEKPDGRFPTCPYPNPEMREAMRLGIETARKQNADLLLATDPDCDRVGVAVKDTTGDYTLLTGNQVGVLLLDYICSQRTRAGTMPHDPVFIKTIVTTELARKVAQSYRVKTVDVLTGFKYIGEQITALQDAGKGDCFLLGFEESYGYLCGTYARDKDAVVASMLICEMYCYYRTQGIDLLQKLNEIYRQFGYCLNRVESFEYSGVDALEKMDRAVDSMRSEVDALGGISVRECKDYLVGVDGLPKSNVLRFALDGDIVVIVRPSGTEPKLKAYLSVSSESEAEAQTLAERIVADLKQRITG